MVNKNGGINLMVNKNSPSSPINRASIKVIHIFTYNYYYY